jgi:MFS family permease
VAGAAAPAEPAASEAPTGIALLAALAAYAGFLDSVNASAARVLAEDFALDDAGVARLFGWIGLAASLAFALSLAADRIGRRRVILGCLGLAPLGAFVSAVAAAPAVFLAAQWLVQGAKGALMNALPVVVTENTVTAARARSQAVLGILGTVGNGTALVAVSVALSLGGTWRWAWALAALPLLALPFVWRRLPETERFTALVQSGSERGRLRELLAPRHRGRLFGVVGVQALLQFGFVAAMGWMIYHPTRHRGVSQTIVTTYVVIGGILGLGGVVLAARLADRWGRRPTFALFAVLFVAATLPYYGLPTDLGPALLPALGLSFATMSACGSGATLAFRTATTELFPTRLRASVLGVNSIAVALSLAGSNFAASVLAARMGGIGPAVSVLVCVYLLAALAFWLFLPETRGHELEEDEETPVVS